MLLKIHKTDKNNGKTTHGKQIIEMFIQPPENPVCDFEMILIFYLESFTITQILTQQMEGIEMKQMDFI